MPEIRAFVVSSLWDAASVVGWFVSWVGDQISWVREIVSEIREKKNCAGEKESEAGDADFWAGETVSASRERPNGAGEVKSCARAAKSEAGEPDFWPARTFRPAARTRAGLATGRVGPARSIGESRGRSLGSGDRVGQWRDGIGSRRTRLERRRAAGNESGGWKIAARATRIEDRDLTDEGRWRKNKNRELNRGL